MYRVIKVSGVYSMAFTDSEVAGEYLRKLVDDAKRIGAKQADIVRLIELADVEAGELEPGFIWACGDCGTLWNPDRFIRKDPDAPFSKCPACGSELIDCQAEEVK